jgi:hypothetical protein
MFTVADVERPDPDRKIGFGYVMNEMGSNATLLDPRTTALISAVYASLRETTGRSLLEHDGER